MIRRSLVSTSWAIVLLLALYVCNLNAQSGAKVRIVPQYLSLEQDEVGSLTVEIAGATNLFGAEVHIGFDPTLVQVVDAQTSQPGVQVAPGSFLDAAQGFLVVNDVNNETGQIVYAVTLLAPAQPISGTGDLLTMQFEAMAGGESAITFETVILASPEGNELAAMSEGATIVVFGPPAPPSPTNSSSTVEPVPGVTNTPPSFPLVTRTPPSLPSPPETSTPSSASPIPQPATQMTVDTFAATVAYTATILPSTPAGNLATHTRIVTRAIDATAVEPQTTVLVTRVIGNITATPEPSAEQPLARNTTENNESNGPSAVVVANEDSPDQRIFTLITLAGGIVFAALGVLLIVVLQLRQH